MAVGVYDKEEASERSEMVRGRLASFHVYRSQGSKIGSPLDLGRFEWEQSKQEEVIELALAAKEAHKNLSHE